MELENSANISLGGIKSPSAVTYRTFPIFIIDILLTREIPDGVGVKLKNKNEEKKFPHFIHKFSSFFNSRLGNFFSCSLETTFWIFFILQLDDVCSVRGTSQIFKEFEIHSLLRFFGRFWTKFWWGFSSVFELLMKILKFKIIREDFISKIPRNNLKVTQYFGL